nr:alpha/beta-hydrolase family protein [Corynebacterium lactis]
MMDTMGILRSASGRIFTGISSAGGDLAWDVASRPASRSQRMRRAVRAALTGTGRGTLRGTLRAGIPSNPGLIGAEIASWAAFSPSLMPRTRTATTVVTFSAQIVGHVTGVAVGYGFNKTIERLATTKLGRLALPPRYQRGLALGWHGAMTAATITIWLKSIAQQKEIARLVGEDSASSARAQLGATATASALYLATRGLTFVANWGYDLLRRNLRPWLPRGVAPVLAGAIVGGGLAASVDLLVIRRALERISVKSRYLNSLVLPGRTQPWEPERSGSPWSMEPWHALGAQGRVIVAEGPRARDLAAVSGRPMTQVQEPIRIYAGKVAGRSLLAQTELIIRELHRTGAFWRDHLVIHTTTGTGWVPSWSLQAVEFLTLGNCAQVALQYSDLPSPIAWLTDHDTPLAAGRALIHRVLEELEELPEDNRPKVYVAGESLGGFGGLGAFSDSTDMLARVDGAVWSGAPQFSPMWKELTGRRDKHSPQIAPVIDGGRHIRFATRPQELFESFYGSDLGEWEFPRVAFLQHASDPIVWGDFPLAWRRPDWLVERLGRDVLPSMRWFPFVTFMQVVIDGVASVGVPSGHGHRYEYEFLPAWAAVLGLPLDDDLDGAADMRFKRIAKWIRRTQPPRA